MYFVTTYWKKSSDVAAWMGHDFSVSGPFTELERAEAVAENMSKDAEMSNVVVLGMENIVTAAVRAKTGALALHLYLLGLNFPPELQEQLVDKFKVV